MPLKPLHMDLGGEDGVRYWLEWVGARRNGILVPPGRQEYVAWSGDEPAGS
jgi:hypothetical protein